MLYRRFGNTGIEVSALGFGCMRLPLADPNATFTWMMERSTKRKQCTLFDGQ
jgi:predicted aldo/keto reductase-like oxidoreductase